MPQAIIVVEALLPTSLPTSLPTTLPTSLPRRSLKTSASPAGRLCSTS